jgi:hypothetical protein
LGNPFSIPQPVSSSDSPKAEITAPFLGARIGVLIGVAREQVMTLPRRAFLHLAAGVAALQAVSPIAWAQTYTQIV